MPSSFVLAGKFLLFFGPENISLIFNYEVSVLLVKFLFSLPYGNITLLESDRDIVRYRVSKLIS